MADREVFVEAGRKGGKASWVKRQQLRRSIPLESGGQIVVSLEGIAVAYLTARDREVLFHIVDYVKKHSAGVDDRYPQ